MVSVETVGNTLNNMPPNETNTKKMKEAEDHFYYHSFDCMCLEIIKKVDNIIKKKG